MTGTLKKNLVFGGAKKNFNTCKGSLARAVQWSATRAILRSLGSNVAKEKRVGEKRGASHRLAAHPVKRSCYAKVRRELPEGERREKKVSQCIVCPWSDYLKADRVSKKNWDSYLGENMGG